MKLTPYFTYPLFFAVAGLASSPAVEISRESFEGGLSPLFSTTGLISSPDQFHLGQGDFWTATDGSSPNIVSATGTPAYSGQNGSRYWAGQDLDADGEGNTDTVVFGPVNVSGFINLRFDGLFAADGIFGSPPTPRYDVGEGLEVAWSLDGSPFATALAFKAENVPGDTTNLQLRKDLDLDGFGEGDILGPAFSSHFFGIPLTGGNLTIRVTGISSSSQEEFAFDNLTISGDVPTTNQSPSANTLTAPDVGEPQIGDSSYAFTISYSDDSAIAVSTIGTGDVTVTGPGGAVTVTGATVSPVGNGTPRTATYTVTPPGGTWNGSDNGVYNVSVNANQIGDEGSPQLFVAGGAIGSFTVSAINTPPAVAQVIAPQVIHSDMGSSSYAFSIVYTDVSGVDASSITTDDITIGGPFGPMIIVSANASGPDGTTVIGNYIATPPGGTWDPGDDGTYQISMAGNQVADIDAGTVAANVFLATFDVDSTCAVRESFEIGAPTYDSGLVTAADKFYSGIRDFWTDTDGSNIASATANPAAYSGENGFRYWAGQDLDQVDDATDTLVLGPVPVSGFTGLTFSGLFAADGISGGIPRYDPGEGIEVAWSIDGSAFTTALAFKSDLASGSNGNIRKDINLDGVGDGGILGTLFSSHSFPIPTTGNNLTIRVTGILNGSQEEVAFDDLKVNGTPTTANQAPVVNGLIAPDVGEPEVGLTSYSFDVIYSDDSAIDASTISTADVTVTRSGGTLAVTAATVSPVGDGSPRTATYTVTPPGGSWDEADAGIYSVAINANQVADTDGSPLFVAAGVIGTFQASPTNAPPVVARVVAPDIGFIDMGKTGSTITVTYTDFGGVLATSIDTGDITVTGPGGALAVASATTTDPTSQVVTATYTITPPGGSWDPADPVGNYTVGITGSNIFDIAGAATAGISSAATFEFNPSCIVQESFEALAPAYDSGLITSPDQFYSGIRDFWTVTDGDTPEIVTASTPYSGEDGTRYWAGQDLDQVDDATDTVLFGPIPIEGFTNLNFSGLFAADGVSGGIPRYDPGEGIEVAWSIDGSPFVTALAYKSELASGSNGNLRKDVDLNGVGDGAILGASFAAEGFPIMATGSELTLRITGILSGSQEEVAFDKIKVSGGAPPFVVGFAPIIENADGPNSVVDLTTGFIDQFDDPSDLSYLLVSNTNPSIFNSVTWSNSTDELTIDYDPNTGGEATIVVRATNSLGRSADAEIFVTSVNPLANLKFLADPTAVSVSSSTSNGGGGTLPPENLYDANPTIADFDSVIFVGGQWGGDGAGPHIVIYEYSDRIVFNGLAYVQRLGGIPTADKVPSMKIWVSETDPRGGLSGLGLFNMPILATPPVDSPTLIQDTNLTLRYYPLGEFLTGRYVIFELAQGTFNPGGAELALTVNAPVELEGLALRDYETGTAIIWSSNPATLYEIRRSTDLDTFTPIATGIPGDEGASSFIDIDGIPRAFYQINDVELPD